MKLNADFTKRVLVHSDEIAWSPSPMAGVDRRPLDRIGDEVARATSIVRYAPGSQFSAHTHHGGEEFLVLEGVFQDEHGDYPEGTYVRNPVGSAHVPGSAPGTTIFVKLWQFDPEDQQPVRANINDIPSADHPHRPGVRSALLFRNADETVTVEFWPPDHAGDWNADGGAELLVLAGTGTESGDAVHKGSWVRVPAGGTVRFRSGPDGARFWMKSGHLRKIRVPQ